MSFLPEDYQVPESSGGKYFSPSKITSGSSVDFRILSDAVTGYEYWTKDNQSVRLKESPKNVPGDIRLDEKGQPERIKHFWSFVAYNYENKAVQLWTITQGTIQQPIIELFRNPKWGSPSNYDLTLAKKGSGLQTEYSVVPSPKEPFSKDWAIAEAAQINLNALYDGSDPFSGAGVETSAPVPQQLANKAAQPSQPFDFAALIASSDIEMKRLGWTQEYAVKFLHHNYGVRSRQLLSEQDLKAFDQYLKAQESPQVTF